MMEIMPYGGVHGDGEPLICMLMLSFHVAKLSMVVPDAEAAPSLSSTNTAAIVSISTMTITRKAIFRSTFGFDFGSKLCDPECA